MVTINKKLIYSILLIILLSLGFYFLHVFFAPRNIVLSKPIIDLNGTRVFVDVATSSQEQEQGLSGRSNLKENEGMLFIFLHPGKYYFWMKDMNFPIDIIWLDKDLKVVYIKKNALPESYPNTFGGEVNSQYVVEVVSGLTDKTNLKIGDTVGFYKPE